MARKRILVVDDEQDIVDLLRDVLGANGYEVDSAGDAATALALVREHIFDAAILDFNLPDMDGVMLHRQLRQMDEELAGRTLFTSGLVQSEGNLGYYTSHGRGFLSKPFDVQEMLDALAGLWSEERA
ncbi:MAG TPA: response regulator [Candidatus Polarisedimenticolaceae bacterium]|nr:response regulator [Candidatus Polarisedimenticolaceae bacterium]